MEQYLVNYNRWLNSDRLSDAERAELLSIKDEIGRASCRERVLRCV